MNLADVWLVDEIEKLFDELEEFARTMEAQAIRSGEEHEKRIRVAQDEEDRSIAEETRHWMSNAIPRVLRYSCVTATVTAVESSLARICRRVQARRKLALALSDLKGNGSQQSRNYLTKVAGIDLRDLNGAWSLLRAWQRVRNCIVHSNGETHATDPRLLRAVKRLAHQGVSQRVNEYSLGGDIWIEEGASSRLIDLGRSLVFGVIDRTELRTARAIR